MDGSGQIVRRTAFLRKTEPAALSVLQVGMDVLRGKWLCGDICILPVSQPQRDAFLLRRQRERRFPHAHGGIVHICAQTKVRQGAGEFSTVCILERVQKVIVIRRLGVLPKLMHGPLQVAFELVILQRLKTVPQRAVTESLLRIGEFCKAADDDGLDAALHL